MWRTQECVPRSHSCERIGTACCLWKSNISPLKYSLISVRVETHLDTTDTVESKRSHECERGTQECVRHAGATKLSDIEQVCRSYKLGQCGAAKL
jgi:hypothetical protein